MVSQYSSDAMTSGEQDVVAFQQLEDYDWKSDPEFQSGLQAILGSNPSPEQAEHLTLRARCFYLARYAIFRELSLSSNAEIPFHAGNAIPPLTTTPTKFGGLDCLHPLPMACQSQHQRLILPQ